MNCPYGKFPVETHLNLPNGKYPVCITFFTQQVYLHVLHGRCDEASKMLLAHPRKTEEAFESVAELLRKIPLDSADTDPTAFDYWQNECARRLQEGYYAAYPELIRVVKVSTFLAH